MFPTHTNRGRKTTLETSVCFLDATLWNAPQLHVQPYKAMRGHWLVLGDALKVLKRLRSVTEQNIALLINVMFDQEQQDTRLL